MTIVQSRVRLEVDLDIPALGTRNVELAELLLADCRAIIAVGVVAGVDVRCSAGRGKTGGHVDPALVVVDDKGDNKVLVVEFEAEDAGSTWPI